MGLTVRVLGSSGSYPGPGEPCSGYLVSRGDTTLWVDAGSGTLANLQQYRELREIDAVLLSHEHPDHWHDLHGFYIACKYYEQRSPVPVYAPRGVRLHAYYAEAPLEWHDVHDGDRVEIGDLAVSFSRTDHPVETLAMRFDGGGKSVGYSADSGPAWSLAALGSPLDLALCEATLTAEEEGKLQHLSARQAGSGAREASVGRLVLTHMPPKFDRERARDEGTAAFGAPVEIAHAGAEFRL